MNFDEQHIYRTIGQRLRDRRQVLRLKQVEVAEQLGLLRSSLANIESGRQRVTIHTLYRFCAALSIDIQDVLPDMEQALVRLPVRGVDEEAAPSLTKMALAKAGHLLEASTLGAPHDDQGEGASP